MKRVWCSLLLGVLLITVLPVKQSFGQFFFMEADLTGKPAPDFTLDTTRNDKVNFTQYRNQQPAVVFFWATWCPHCREQLKEINTKREQFAADQVKLAVIDLAESKKQVEKYLKKNNIELEVFLDVEGELESKYQLMGVPTFYFINKEGNVTAVRHSLPEDYQTLFNN